MKKMRLPPSPRHVFCRAALGAAIGILLGACAGMGPQWPTFGPPRSAGQVTCDQPTLTIVEGEGEAIQTSGAISIIASADLPRCERLVRVDYRSYEARAGIGGIGHVIAQDAVVRAEEEGLQTTGVSYEGADMEAEMDVDVCLPQPLGVGGDLRYVGCFAMVFEVVNQSARVFRPDGAVWAASLDGTMLDSQAAGWLRTTIIPGARGQMRVHGIPLPQPGDGGVYTFSLYDVPIAKDEAGNVTEVANYEWYYTLDWDILADEVTITECVVKDIGIAERADLLAQDAYLIADRAADPARLRCS